MVHTAIRNTGPLPTESADEVAHTRKARSDRACGRARDSTVQSRRLGWAAVPFRHPSWRRVVQPPLPERAIITHNAWKGCGPQARTSLRQVAFPGVR